MKHQSVYWVKFRRRFVNTEPKEGIVRDWEPARYNAHLNEWETLGTEITDAPEFVAEVGPELLPPV